MFQILFEDNHLCVLSKSSGLLSQGDISGETNLVDLLRTHFGRNYVGLIHRLDRNTSGLMIIAKRSKSADRLSEQLRNGTLKRAYVALIEGHLATPAIWKHELVKDSKTNLTRAYKEKRKDSKSAVLKVTPLKYQPDMKLGQNKGVATDKPLSLPHTLAYTLARFDLETGRSHQIRAQAAAEKHPLVGDRKYGSSSPPPYFLHSFQLEFTHPMSHEPMRFEELPEWGRS